jgi:ubiquinone/menaquinone biosynthesis C-methylase UbiE
LAGWRWELLGRVRGRTLEIGCGWGYNFAHYPPEAAVAAFDVDATRLRTAAGRGPQIPLAVADAQQMPWPSGSFEAVVGTLVLCSISHPASALAETRRVLRPGGQLYLVEHVRSHQVWLGQVQDWLAPAWLWGTGGCHLNRDTEATVRSAGFEIDTLKVGYGGLLKLIIARPR